MGNILTTFLFGDEIMGIINRIALILSIIGGLNFQIWPCCMDMRRTGCNFCKNYLQHCWSCSNLVHQPFIQKQRY